MRKKYHRSQGKESVSTNGCKVNDKKIMTHPLQLNTKNITGKLCNRVFIEEWGKIQIKEGESMKEKGRKKMTCYFQYLYCVISPPTQFLQLSLGLEIKYCFCGCFIYLFAFYTVPFPLTCLSPLRVQGKNKPDCFSGLLAFSCYKAIWK